MGNVYLNAFAIAIGLACLVQIVIVVTKIGIELNRIRAIVEEHIPVKEDSNGE